MLSFPFCLYKFQRLSFVLSFWPVFVDFLSKFPVEFPIRIFIFYSWFLRGSQFSHKLILPLHSLDHLIRLYHLLIYTLLVIYFFRFHLHSMFLSGGKVVFSRFIILFRFPWFIFCSCVSVCSVLFGCALFGCVAILFSKVGGYFGSSVSVFQ